MRRPCGSGWLRSSWSQTASLAASEAEWEAEAFAPALLRLALMSSIGLHCVMRLASRMKEAPSRKPSR